MADANVGIGKIWNVFQTMPSTNVRIAVTMVMAIATCVRVVVVGWDPSEVWCGFLIIWSGLDVGQFLAKRTTSTEYVAAKQGTPPGDPPAPPAAPEVGT